MRCLGDGEGDVVLRVYGPCGITTAHQEVNFKQEPEILAVPARGFGRLQQGHCHTSAPARDGAVVGSVANKGTKGTMVVMPGGGDGAGIQGRC